MDRIEIKNLLYHPIQVVLSDGETTSIRGRKKKIFEREDIHQRHIDTLKKKQYIKVKNL